MADDYPAFELRTPGGHVGETVEIAGWLYNLRKSGKIVFPAAARRHRHHAVRGREGESGRSDCLRR